MNMLINKFEYINITLFIFDIIFWKKHLRWNRAPIEAPIAATLNLKKGFFGTGGLRRQSLKRKTVLSRGATSHEHEI